MWGDYVSDSALTGEKILCKSTSEKLPKSALALTVAPHLQSPAPKQLGLYFFFPGQQLAETRDLPPPRPTSPRACGWSPA